MGEPVPVNLRTIELVPKRKEAIELFRQNPSLSPAEVGRTLGVGQSTVRGWKKRYLPDYHTFLHQGTERISTKLITQKKEAEEYFLSNPNASPSEVAKLLDISRSTVRNWKDKLRRRVQLKTPHITTSPQIASPTSLKNEVVKLRDDLQGMLRLIEQAIPGIEALEALERSLRVIQTLQNRIEHITSQRDDLQKKIIERCLVVHGD